MSEDTSKQLEELKKQYEELKKAQISPEKKSLVDTLEILGVKSPQDLQDFIKPPSNSYKAPKEETTKSETIEDRVKRIESESVNKRRDEQISKIRRQVISKIEGDKSKYPYLASQTGDISAIDNIISVSENFKRQTGKWPDVDELFKAQNTSYKERFEHQAKQLGIDPQTAKLKVEEEAKETEKTEEVKVETVEKEEIKDIDSDKEEGETYQDEFQLKTPVEINKMEKKEQYKYFFNEEEAKKEGKRLVRVKAKETPVEEEVKEPEKTEEVAEVKEKKVVLPSGGEKSEAPKTEPKNDEQRRLEKMKAVGFEV